MDTIRGELQEQSAANHQSRSTFLQGAPTRNRQSNTNPSATKFAHRTRSPCHSKASESVSEIINTMSAEKRPADDDPGSNHSLVKRQNVGPSTSALARLNASSSALTQTTPRTSGLQAPVMELSGHTGEIFTAKFDLSGNLIASGAMDRTISMSALLCVDFR